MRYQPKIILFNGPPFSGKDTIANAVYSKLVEDNIPTDVVKFAAPLKETATHIYCGGDRDMFDDFDSPKHKNVPHDVFFGKTPREVQIGISEVFFKPFHGQNIFGKLLAADIMRKSRRTMVFLVSDSGFRPEAEELIKQFTPKDILLIRLHKEGCTYDGDSRNYIDLEDLGVNTFDVTNVQGDLAATVNDVMSIIKSTTFLGI